jgi:hypothetical protein
VGVAAGSIWWQDEQAQQIPVSLGRVMRTVSKVLLALCLLWNVGALAQQPTPFLPYPDLTPGGVFDVTLQDICTPGYSKKVRAVTKALRDQAYKSYGITSYQPGEYQLDHLIPLSIGGSNSIGIYGRSQTTHHRGTRARKMRSNSDCASSSAPVRSILKPRSVRSQLTG